ncbi:MAG: hypothetical protein QNK40_11465 [Desulfobacterales bacterium]|nr:hypothetical protein [Desulfobacterales bacterium]
MTKGKATILYVDQALSFGGSIVVPGGMIEGLDKEKYRPVVVGEMDESILNFRLQEQAKIYLVPRLFNYMQWERVVSAVKQIKLRLLFKLIIYLMSAIRSLANVTYIVRLARIILTWQIR